MTTSPRKLADQPQKPDIIVKHQLIASTEDLLTEIASDDVFRDYEIETPDTDMISLTREGLTKIFVAPPLWQDAGRLGPYLANCDDANMCLILVGTEDDFGTLPGDLQMHQIQQLGLPLGRINLIAAINNLHNYQSMHYNSDTEAKSVREATENVKYVMSISRELNGERDIPKLLNLILTKAREICNADAGSIYTCDSPTARIEDGEIRFRFTQNDSIQQNLSEFTMPVNTGSVVGSAILHQVAINIPDLGNLSPDPGENPYGVRHDRRWDERTGYQSHSMLTLPMFDISHNVIGVIQMINRKRDKNATLLNPEDFSEQVRPFSEVDQEYAEIVAQQAGIALENAKMQEDIQNLFDGFVNASVTAIEQRDPTTSGHSHRVAHLTVGLAKVVNRVDVGTYKNVQFSDDQLQEVEYASLLHDFGKLGVRENVLIKAKKLYPWQSDLVLQRFELIRSYLEIDYLKMLLQFQQAPDKFPMGVSMETFAAERTKKIKELDQFFEFIKKANEPTVLEQGGFEKLKDIANTTFCDRSGENQPYLLSDELKALSVSRGSLTREEFAEIQSHVTHTYGFLRQIPWGKRLANVPQIAAKHHEKLDGIGLSHLGGGRGNSHANADDDDRRYFRCLDRLGPPIQASCTRRKSTRYLRYGS